MLGRTKIRSNLHPGQYTTSVPSDLSQRKALVEPLSLHGVTRHIKKLLCEAAQKKGKWTSTIHTSGFDFDWFKVVFVRR